MFARPTLDLDLLRTLVCIAEEASFTRAAERIGRTQSAVTLQVQRLESLVQQPIVARSKGGPVELTPQGHALVEIARTMLALNEEAFRAVGERGLPATIRLGTERAYIPCYLSASLEALRSQYPNVLVEVTDGYSCQLAPRIKDDTFDLLLCEGAHVPRQWPAVEIWRGPLRWITSNAHAQHRRCPLPLCLTPSDCPWRPAWMDDCYWRSAALLALRSAGMPHRIVASANSMEGLYAPVLTGEAVTVSIGAKLPSGLRVVEDDEGLPPLPSGSVVLMKARTVTQPMADVLAEIIKSAFSIA